LIDSWRWLWQAPEMRTSRILGDESRCYYHVLSRTSERKFIIGELEQEYFKRLMRAQEAFSGVRVIAWTCMSNHFHLLVAVEDRNSEEVQAEIDWLMDDDAAFLARLKIIYLAEALDGIEEMLKMIRGDVAAGVESKHLAAQFKQPFLDRLYDLSAFVGEVKQRFSLWYNKRNERVGPLWTDRFTSVLVRAEAGVLTKVAAHIDLNSVRAGIVKDPREWRWCGYAEASKGPGVARNGVYEFLGITDAARRDRGAWRKTHRQYRELLMGEGG
jgi:putative transposase